MRLTIFFLLAIFLQVSAKTYSQKITLIEKDASLAKVFKEIKKQTGYQFFYRDDLVQQAGKITIRVKDVSIEEALNECFKDQPLSYTIIAKTILVKRKEEVIVKAIPDAPPPVEISGHVTDEQGKAVQGVSVVVKGTKIGVTTNDNGDFTINVPDNSSKVLIFSYIGMATQEMPVNGKTTIAVQLKTEITQQQDIVIVGYGAVRKSDLTGSVSSVTSEKLTQVKGISNVAQALQGQAAGVQVNQASGQPGEAMIIKIRGTNSINASNAPLYVVDGLPLDNLSAQLNPDDIERVEVLKDASSIAIYGSRGANGVILITTKKGKEGKPTVSYNGYYGVQTLRRKIKLVNASEFAQLQNEVVANDNASGVNATPKAQPWTAAQIDSLKGKGTDWQDLVYRPANMQNHDLSIAGGSATTKYYISFGYFNQDGIIKRSNFTRQSFRANLNQQISDRLSWNTSFSLQSSKYVQAVYTGADGGGGIPFTTEVLPPTQGVYDANGNYTVFTGVSYGATNPVGISRELYNPSNSLRVIGNTGIVYNIIGGLKLKLSAGIDASFNKNDYYAPSTISIGPRASKSYSNSSTFVNENLLTYNTSFNRHSIDALAGITYQKSKSQNLNSGTAVGFITDIYQNNNIQAATTLAQPSTGYSDSKLASYLGRINYNYDGKYFATVTGRYDGSSVFGDNNKFGFFPSGAIAWRVSQENFMKTVSAISNLKVRASYGKSGNQAIGPYQTLPRVNSTNLNFSNQANIGYTLGGLPNPSLKWETTSELDLGVDLGLLRDRIQFVADYYNKKTTDLLLGFPIPGSTGFGSVTKNAGSVQNRGFEFQLITNNIVTGAFKWTSILTFSRNKSKLLSLGNNSFGKPITYQEIGTAGANWFPDSVGFGMNELYGYKITGIYQTDQEAIDNGEPNKRAGDYKELNRQPQSNHIIDGTDRMILTHLQPKFTFGFNNSFSFQRFDLSLMIVGSYGNDIVNEFRKYNVAMTGQWTPTKEAFDHRWRGPGTSNTIDKPSVNSAQTLLNYANSNWVENGSYIKLRDITLGYNFSSALLNSVKISGVRIYASVQNFITITKYSGYDPEISWAASTVNGWDRGNYPSVKSVTFGAKVTF